MLLGDVSVNELSLEDFILFRDFIHEKSGIYFAENKKYLIENRLNKRIATLGIKSYKDYFYKVKYDTSLKELNMLMNLVTTNETSFFRNPPQLKSFQEELLPLLKKEKQASGQRKQLRIWSAGCSTGEEPYTLAIIILEVLGESNDWNIEIIANDISDNVLYAARKGFYNEMTLRTTPPNIIEKYFTKQDQKYCIAEKVKRLVKFSQINLSDKRQMALMKDFDVIFCRNVMIYFSEDIKKQIVRGYYNSLRPGGHFFIGHSESLHGISKAFKLVYFKNALIYNKEAAKPTTAMKTGSTPAAMPATTSRTRSSVAATPTSAVRTRDVSSAHQNTMDKLQKIQQLLASTRK